MVFPIFLVSFVKYSSNHRVHKRADGFYHGRKTVSCYNVVFEEKQYVHTSMLFSIGENNELMIFINY